MSVELICLLGKKQVGKDTLFNNVEYDDKTVVYNIKYATPIKEFSNAVFIGSGACEEPENNKNNQYVINIDFFKKCLKESFFDFFKQMNGSLDKLSIEEFEKNQDKFINEFKQDNENILISPRRLQQYYGTDFIRNNFDDDIFIKYVEKEISNIIEKSKQDDKKHLIYVTDCRFPNELNILNTFEDINKKLLYVFREKAANDGEKKFISFNTENDNHISEKMNSDIEVFILNTLNSIYSKEASYKEANWELGKYFSEKYNIAPQDFRIVVNVHKENFGLEDKPEEEIKSQTKKRKFK